MTVSRIITNLNYDSMADVTCHDSTSVETVNHIALWGKCFPRGLYGSYVLLHACYISAIQVRIRCYYHRLWLHHGLILRPNSIMHCPFVMLPPQCCPEALPCVRALSSFISSQQSKPETIMNSTKLRPFEPNSPLRKVFPKRATWFICNLSFTIPHSKPNTRIS